MGEWLKVHFMTWVLGVQTDLPFRFEAQPAVAQWLWPLSFQRLCGLLLRYVVSFSVSQENMPSILMNLTVNRALTSKREFVETDHCQKMSFLCLWHLFKRGGVLCTENSKRRCGCFVLPSILHYFLRKFFYKTVHLANAILVFYRNYACLFYVVWIDS